MNWLEIHIDTTSEGIEPLSDKLIAIGLEDFAIEDEKDFEDFLENNRTCWDYVDESLLQAKRGVSRITLYVSDEDQQDEFMELLQSATSELRTAREDIDFGTLAISFTVTDDTEWATAWMKYYKPFKVGERLYVKPEWETLDDPEGRVVFVCNPGLAFGSGTHETTQLCMKALEERIHGGEVVLDMGCGSGILSIVAALLGASYVVGADIDRKAAEVSRSNAALNHVSDRTEFHACDLCQDSSCADRPGGYDIIVMNIVADVILALLPKAKELLSPKGTLILSGIIDARLEDILSAVQKTGFVIQSVQIDNNWCAVIVGLQA